MISHTFKPFTGIGSSTERHFRDRGIHTWEDLLAYQGKLPLSAPQHQTLIKEIRECLQAKAEKNLRFLSRRFPSEEKWRLLAEYLPQASYLDIETTGLEREATITVIACFHRGQLHTFSKEII